VDEKGRETRLTYHANNLDVHLVQVKDGGSWRTLKSFDSYENHAPTQITDASGVVTTIDYNLQGQVLSMSVTKPGTTPATPVLTTRYTYSDDVNSDSETDGYLVKVEQTDPANASAFVQTAAFTYETTGAKRVKTATDERGYTITYTSYDHFDRPLLITHPDGSTEQFVYNRLDLEATKARDGTWSRARYNHLRQLVLSQDSLGRTSSYDWCRCGQLKSLTDPLGRTTRYVRDIQGRVLEKVLPDASKFVYQYQTQSGRLANMRTPKDAAAAQPTVAYKYDLDSRLLEQDYTDANTPDVSFAFADFLGRLTSHTDQLGSTSYAYHPLDGSTPGAGELASIDGPWDDDTVFYEFDAYGRPKKQEIRNDATPNAATHSVEMAYDALSRVTSIVNPLGTFDYDYSDVSDRVQSISTTAGDGFEQTFGYHPLTTPGAGGDRDGGVLRGARCGAR
jgi:YD repeat-containing protein